MIMQSKGEVMSKKMRIDLWIWVKTPEILHVELALIWVLFLI